MGIQWNQYTIVDSPRTDTVYGCYIPITVGACSGGSFNYDSVRCGMYFQGKWIVDTKRNPPRQIKFIFKAPNTDGHIGRSNICITWFRKGNPVATSDSGVKELFLLQGKRKNLYFQVKGVAPVSSLIKGTYTPFMTLLADLFCDTGCGRI